jgi:hypothetical protein
MQRQALQPLFLRQDISETRSQPLLLADWLRQCTAPNASPRSVRWPPESSAVPVLHRPGCAAALPSPSMLPPCVESERTTKCSSSSAAGGASVSPALASSSVSLHERWRLAAVNAPIRTSACLDGTSMAKYSLNRRDTALNALRLAWFRFVSTCKKTEGHSHQPIDSSTHRADGGAWSHVQQRYPQSDALFPGR